MRVKAWLPTAQVAQFLRAESLAFMVFLRLFFCYSVLHKVAYFLGSKFKVIALELSAVVGLS